MSKYFNKIVLQDGNGVPKNSTVIQSKNDFLRAFKEQTNTALKEKWKLVVEYYEGIQGNLEALDYLTKIDDFQIQDFTALKPDFVPILIEHTKLAKSAKSSKIKESITKRRNVGKTIGNPEIGNIARDLGLKQRIRNSLFDERNLKAKKRIIALKHKGLSDNAIAKILNQEEILTRRDKPFYQKSVQRLYERYEKLQTHFIYEKKIFEQLNKITNASTTTLKDFTNGKNFEEIIQFQFTNAPIQIKLYNHKGTPILPIQHCQEKGPWELSITDTIALLPGLIYFQLFNTENVQLYTGYFKIKESLIEDI